MSNIPKWAYTCPRGKNGLHTWRRTGQREEFACANCNLTLTKEESRDLGFEPCRHYWKAVIPMIAPIDFEKNIPPKLATHTKICIHCGSTG